MNILFTFPFVIDPKKGGTERVTDIVARELKSRGHNIFYLSFHTIPSINTPDFPGVAMSIKEYDEFDEVGIQEYKKILIDNKIDIIINQGGIMASCRFFCHTEGTSAKVITVLHINPRLNLDSLLYEKSNLQEIGTKGQIRRLLRILYFPKSYLSTKKYLTNHYSRLLSITDRFVLLSEKFVPELLSIYPTAPLHKVYWINNPLTYIPETVENKDKTILFVGRFSPQKNPLLLIDVWTKIHKSFPEWNVLMLGNGKLFELVKHKSRKLPRIKLIGNVDPEPYYRKASVLCMTSAQEGWGMVLVEAMAYGCVPVAFDSYCSCCEILPDERQRVAPFSIDKYCDTLSSILDSVNLRKELVQKGYKTLSKFSTSLIGERWEQLINELVNEK